jgi:ADP-heptose:LPS heptosyltransferase
MIVFEYVKLFFYLLHPKSLFIKSFSGAIGDNLLLSLMLPHVKKKYPEKKIIVKTNHPELFENNPYIVWATNRHFKTTKKFIRPKYHLSPELTKSIYLQMMEYFGFDYKGFPEIYLTKEEKQKARKEFPNDYVVICPTGKQRFSGNRKEWGIDNFQKVVDAFPDIEFVQIGLLSDRLLQGVSDARGKKIRESAAILNNSLFFLGLEGGLMHIAKAVGKKAVIIYGGLVSPESSAYEENCNITNTIHCSPCFNSDMKIGDCDSMQCMKQITPEKVIDSVKKMLESEIKEKRS